MSTVEIFYMELQRTNHFRFFPLHQLRGKRKWATGFLPNSHPMADGAVLLCRVRINSFKLRVKKQSKQPQFGLSIHLHHYKKVVLSSGLSKALILVTQTLTIILGSFYNSRRAGDSIPNASERQHPDLIEHILAQAGQQAGLRVVTSYCLDPWFRV